MDYEMKISISIDTLTKKNAVRDALVTQLQNAVTSENITAWSMDIKGIINQSEDYESYTG